MRLDDHDLSVITEAGAAGAYNSKAAHWGGPFWDDIPAGTKNDIRETALPFIFHGTQALEDLGYVKPRTVATPEELANLPAGTVLRDASGRLWEWEHVGYGGVDKALSAMGIGSMLAPSAFREFPATVLHGGQS